MSKQYVLLEDLTAAEIGLDPGMGLLHTKGAILDSFLPGVKEKLLELGKITEDGKEPKVKPAPANKAKRANRETK